MIVLGHLERGGAELRTLQALRHILEKPDPPEVQMFVVSGKRGALAVDFEAAGVKLVMGRPGPIGLLQLLAVLRRSRVDVLHANASLAGGFYTCVAWLAGVPIRIAHIRTIGYDDKGLARRFKDSIFRVILNLFSTRVVGVVDACRDFAGTRVTRWTTLYNGIQPPPPDLLARPDPYKELRLLMLGRVSTPKNPLRALSILAELRRLEPGLTLYLDVVGRMEGSLAEQFRTMIGALGMDGVVRCHGESSAPFAWIRSSSVVVMPSVREGLPGVVLEAIAAGTPVVASNLPGVVEIARHLPGITLCDLDNPDADWAHAILKAARCSDSAALTAAFAAGPFQFEKHCAGLLMLWEHSSDSAGVRTEMECHDVNRA